MWNTFTCVVSLEPYGFVKRAGQIVFIPHLQMKKLRFRKVRVHGQEHAANQWWRWDVNQSLEESRYWAFAQLPLAHQASFGGARWPPLTLSGPAQIPGE